MMRWSARTVSGRLLRGILLIALFPSAGALAADSDQGRHLFMTYCAECHGESGDGWGLRHEITAARPRSFQSARFKLATTENGVPTDQDLRRTIRLGMNGSGMPSWSQLPTEEIAALADYVRGIGTEALRSDLEQAVAVGRLTAIEADEVLIERTQPGRPIDIPEEPGFGGARALRGQEVYLEACAPCHGHDGNSVQGNIKADFEGNLLLATPIADGLFKGGGEGEQLYARIWKGVGGTAMPAYAGAYSPDEVWNVVHYVQWLAGLRPLPDGLVAELLALVERAKPVLEPVELLESTAVDEFWGDVVLGADGQTDEGGKGAANRTITIWLGSAALLLALVVFALSRRRS